MPYADPQKAAEQKRAWKLANPEKVRASQRQASIKYYHSHPEKAGSWQKTNRNRANASKRAWRAAHPEQWTSPYEVYRTRMRDVLRGHLKAARSKELLGCTPVEFRAHLESLFQPGMTWKNRGQFGWHIDHIRPAASFNLDDPAQQRACFHFTNLQPLWWRENLAKSDRWSRS